MSRHIHLFNPLRLRSLEFRNRIFMSPMCQYSAVDGVPNNWHFVHLGTRAVGGVGLVMVEATGVSPEGRISPGDTGLWSDEQARAFAPIVAFIREQGAVAAIQLAHAGRKASTRAPWLGDDPLTPEEGAWTPLAPSAIAFDEGYPVPRELTREDIDTIVEEFRTSTRLSLEAGFQLVEVHMAHGYLLHEFLSPLSNRRTDEYGGSLENRMRFPLRVARAVREGWPDDLPVFVRISATDWVEDGWNLEEAVVFCRQLRDMGIDLIDCSSGGVVPKAPIPVGPGYQTGLAATIRRESGIPTGAVGLIVQPFQAEHILATGQADAVFLARELLRSPYWPLKAAQALGATIDWPAQYDRARD